MAESRNTPPRGPRQQGQNQNAGRNPRAQQNPNAGRGRQQRAQGRGADEDDKEKEEPRNRITPQMLNAYPAMLPDDKPPFDIGNGWLEWADKKAAGLLDTTFDGVMEDLQGKGATRERLARMQEQRERHGNRDHSDPQSPPRTPAGGNQTAQRGGGGRNGGNNNGGRA